MGPNKFYDIHFHAMDLSHANITAFIDRFVNNEEEVKKYLKKYLPVWLKVIGSIFMPLFGPIVPYSLLSKLLSNKIQEESKVRNLLSFMETSVLYDFLIVEYFLKNSGNKNLQLVSEDNELDVAGKKYNKIVLCPLIMDFGYNYIKNSDCFYDIPPQKPVTSQIKDLMSAISTYYKKDISIGYDSNSVTEFKVTDTNIEKGDKLFEIFPFMSINTENYSIETIEKMLNKYFADFSKDDTKEVRYKKLYDAMGNFKGDLEDEENCKNIFAGIKLYPPLGFNPWPDDQEEKEKKEKVVLLYETCVDKNIPITTHCSPGGFLVKNKYRKYTNPSEYWEKVLADSRFSKLKINFAHMGGDKKNWVNKIFELALNPDHNIYTDFSCNGITGDYYEKLRNKIVTYEAQINDKILYGSDFMINLLKIKSLNEYMECFIESNYLTNNQKIKFINENPENFLFG